MMKNPAMQKVGGGIYEMVDSLELQQGEETSRVDWCQDEIANTEKKMQNEKFTQDREKSTINVNNEDLKKLKYEVKQLNYAQEDADIELQKAANDRKKANTAFQQTVMNQIGTKTLLKTALEILNSFYDKLKKK